MIILAHHADYDSTADATLDELVEPAVIFVLAVAVIVANVLIIASYLNIRG